MEEKEEQILSQEPKVSKSRNFIGKIAKAFDVLIWLALGFLTREILTRWGLIKMCPMLSECQRCFQYGGQIIIP